MVKLSASNKSSLIEEMLADLDDYDNEFRSFSKLTHKYIKYFAENCSFSIRLCQQLLNQNWLSSIRDIL